MNLRNNNEFKPQYQLSKSVDDHDLIFIHKNNTIALIESLDGIRMPTAKDLPERLDRESNYYHFGDWQNKKCILIDNPQSESIEKLTCLKFFESKRTHLILDDSQYQLISYASHIHHWRRHHCFCGACGAKTVDKADERAKVCEACHEVYYPRISPCIIVLIKRDDKILLARSPHFQEGVYSCLAGFMEPGESAEETLHREVMEEVGIKVKNLKYVASQPWPFPDSLMLGYTADYASGEIAIDGMEIEAADWFRADNTPELPNSTSIARKLINRFCEAAGPTPR